MENKKEMDRELRLLAQRIRHEITTPVTKEKMLDHIRKILTLMDEKRFCKKCGSEMHILPGDDIAHDINVCKKCGDRTIGLHQEPYGMDKTEIHEALDKIRDMKDCWLCDRIASYIDANIDEFMECFENEGE